MGWNAGRLCLQQVNAHFLSPVFNVNERWIRQPESRFFFLPAGTPAGFKIYIALI